MTFFQDWFNKFIFLLTYRFVKLVEIKPFIKIDRYKFCPVCGDTGEKHIQAVSDGQNTNCRLACKGCGWIWDEPTVTEIAAGSLILSEQTQEEETPEETARRDTPRFITITAKGESGVKVNGEVLPDKHGDYRKKPKAV